MREQIQAFLEELDRAAETQQADADSSLRFAGLARLAQDHLSELFSGIARRRLPESVTQENLLRPLLERLSQRFHPHQQSKKREQLSPELREPLPAVYRNLGRESPVRHHLLAMLSGSAAAGDLSLLAELVADDPPASSTDAVVALSPLLQQRNIDPRPLFPRLLDAIGDRSCTGVILDVANYFVRSELVARHPAASRLDQLAQLLGSLTQELAKLEETPSRDVGEAAQRVAEGVALAVSLCDALALIGNRSVVGKLYQSLEIGHRRLRTEAAAALARLDEEAGRDALVELASEPVARLRVLAYAEELGLLDRIAGEYQTTEARAESELALCLAQPSLFGLPPTSCELIDTREQYWPGYNDPVECFLFRYTYEIGEATFSNIGIAGPLVHAFTADLADLSPDDIYAIYAGWQAEHEDIRETDVQALSEFQRREVSRLERRLHDAGYASIEPQIVGSFFGEKVLVVAARRDGVPGHAVIDSNDIYWHPQVPTPRPLGPSEIYCIYKGKKLLRTFNP